MGTCFSFRVEVRIHAVRIPPKNRVILRPANSASKDSTAANPQTAAEKIEQLWTLRMNEGIGAPLHFHISFVPTEAQTPN